MDEMVIIGMDPHKASNTIAVLDSTENLLTWRRFENSDDGFVEMLAAVGEYPNRVWAVEGANPAPTQPGREPSTEPRALHRCDRPDSQRHTRARLLPSKARRRQEHQRGTALLDAPNQRRRLAEAPTRPSTRPDPGPRLAPLAFQAREPPAIQIARHATHERPAVTLQTRSRLTSMPGSGCGLTEASAPRRKLITPADRKVQQTSSSAHPEPTS